MATRLAGSSRCATAGAQALASIFLPGCPRLDRGPRRPPDGRLRVLSYEGLSGELWRGNFDSKRNADRIHQTFPNARILIVVRRQGGPLESLYKQYLLTGGVLSMPEFLAAGSPSICNRHRLSPDDRLISITSALWTPECGSAAYELMPRMRRPWRRRSTSAACPDHLQSAARLTCVRGYSAANARCSVASCPAQENLCPAGFTSKLG